MTHWLAALANNRHGPDPVSVGELEAYCGQYPFCQVSRMLLAIARKRHTADEAGLYIQLAMAYAPDRQLFHQRLGSFDISGNKNDSDKVLAPELVKETTGFIAPYFEGLRLIDDDLPEEAPQEEDAVSDAHRDKQQRQLDIIDRFLQADPRIMSDKEADKSSSIPVEDEDQDPVVLSETFAEILVRQGQSSKALGIYEKLCLKYPEKSSYFAKKIETLKKEMG